MGTLIRFWKSTWISLKINQNDTKKLINAEIKSL